MSSALLGSGLSSGALKIRNLFKLPSLMAFVVSASQKLSPVDQAYIFADG